VSRREAPPLRLSRDGSAGDKKKKKAEKGRETYKFYIFKVLKQVRSDFCISRKAKSIMNSFINDTFEKLAQEASRHPFDCCTLGISPSTPCRRGLRR
ncbi:hypothetical protein BHM03_00036926, partial [Ensete ventricosum]